MLLLSLSFFIECYKSIKERRRRMKYIDALLKSSKKLEAEFDSSTLINHNASKGAFREYIIQSCIRPFLPQAYGIAGGECCDMNGNVSKQLDAVVYDKLYSYIVPYTKEFIQFPYESVYGNIEIKTFLDKNELANAINNIISLKSLCRREPDAAQIVPNRMIEIEGIEWNNKGTNEIFGIIFSFDSLSPEKIIEHLRTIDSALLPFLPNMIVLYKSKTIIVRIKYGEIEKDKFYPNFYGDYDGFMSLPCGDYTLPIFIADILIHSSNERIVTMGLEDIMNPIIDEALHAMPPQKVARYK